MRKERIGRRERKECSALRVKMKREKRRDGEESSRVTVSSSQDTELENKVSIFFYSLSFFLSISLSSIFFPSPLISNLIFIATESLKQFTWSASDMKIDNCDLPGKQKWRGVVMCKCMLF